MSESITVAGQDLTPIAAGYEPHGYVFAVGDVTYRVTPLGHTSRYTLQCVTTDWEAARDFGTLEEAVTHACQRQHWRASSAR